MRFKFFLCQTMNNFVCDIWQLSLFICLLSRCVLFLPKTLNNCVKYNVVHYIFSNILKDIFLGSTSIA